MITHAASRKHYYTVLLDRTLVCFLLVVVLNFFLPRLLPGASDGKDILYAKQRGLPDSVIRRDYLLRSIAQPFLTMLGMSVSLCVGGSVVIEKIFSIGGMGSLLTEAVYTLDYPLMQGILFVTTCIMVLAILLTDFLCLLLDPKRRLEGSA